MITDAGRQPLCRGLPGKAQARVIAADPALELVEPKLGCWRRDLPLTMLE